MKQYVSRHAQPWETPIAVIAEPSTSNKEIIFYNFMGMWRLTNKKTFLHCWKPAENRPTN
jgi:hypothetical protein